VKEISDATEDRLFHVMVELCDFLDDHGFPGTALQMEVALDTFLEETTHWLEWQQTAPEERERERSDSGRNPENVLHFRSGRKYQVLQQQLISIEQGDEAERSRERENPRRIHFV
jgi:hypothetical protein